MTVDSRGGRRGPAGAQATPAAVPRVGAAARDAAPARSGERGPPRPRPGPPAAVAVGALVQPRHTDRARRPRPGARQRLRRAALAVGKVRRGLLEGLRLSARGPRRVGGLFRVLESRATRRASGLSAVPDVAVNAKPDPDRIVALPGRVPPAPQASALRGRTLGRQRPCAR